MLIYYNNAEQRKLAMKSFSAFLAIHSSKICRNGKFICDYCDGLRQIVADWERPDPVEGYKMAQHVTCPSCHGNGLSNEKYWRDYFKNAQTKYRQDAKEALERAAIKKRALKKLTKEEREVLGF